MRTLSTIAITVAAVACSTGERHDAPVEEASEEASACMKGCAVAPAIPPEQAEMKRLIEAVAGQPLGEPSMELETLLFHAEATREFLSEHGTSPLDAERAALLETELRRTHAIVDMRVVDATGVVRARVDAKKVPLGIKEHLWFSDLVDIQPFEASGTVVRVGLGHIWTRY